MSMKRCVPAAVPSLVQSSVPAAAVLAGKKSLLPTAANSVGDDELRLLDLVVLMSLTRYGVWPNAASEERRRRRAKAFRMWNPLAELMDGQGLYRPSALEPDRVADVDRAPFDDLAERAAAPVWPQRVAEAFLRLVHPLARTHLAADVDQAGAEAEQPAAHVLEV